MIKNKPKTLNILFNYGCYGILNIYNLHTLKLKNIKIKLFLEHCSYTEK